MKKDEFHDVEVVCKDGKTRTFRFLKGLPEQEGEPQDMMFCQRNCKYYGICKDAKSPSLNVDDPKNDSLEIWCSSQEVDSSFYPSDIHKYYPRLFDGIDMKDPAFTLSEIKANLCSKICMDFVPDTPCDKCTPDNKMCLISGLLISSCKKKN